MRAKESDKFDFLSPCEVISNQFTIPANTPYRVSKIFKKTHSIRITIVFQLIDSICYHHDLEYKSLEDARAAGWAV